MDASAPSFARLGKTDVTVSGSVVAAGPSRTWSVRGILVGVTHQNPTLTGGQGFLTILTVAPSWADGNLSNLAISPSADVAIEDD